FGQGVNEGETTFHLLNLYGQWGPLLAGQANTVFMDPDTFPNVIDYWGPPGMVYVRNPQIRYTHMMGANEIAVAFEEAANDIDPGNIRVIDPALGFNLQGNQKFPDLTAHYRYNADWGHIQVGGILRSIGFETLNTVNNAPKGDDIGWGINVSGNWKASATDTLHLSVVFGEGIASYMNDGGVDLGPKGEPGHLTGESVPLVGFVGYYDHSWNEHWTSSFGYSRTEVDNTSFQE